MTCIKAAANARPERERNLTMQGVRWPPPAIEGGSMATRSVAFLEGQSKRRNSASIARAPLRGARPKAKAMQGGASLCEARGAPVRQPPLQQLVVGIGICKQWPYLLLSVAKVISLWRRQKVLTFRKKRELKLSQRRILIDSIRIGLASPDQMRAWAERQLPNGKRIGRVANPKTVDYKTLRPIRDGLFCERIFGPVRDYLCSCGKRPGSSKAHLCPDCEVEWTESRVRRYRLGYIELGSPVAHVWYTKGQPNYVAAVLGETRQSIEAITYCTRFMVGRSGGRNDSCQSVSCNAYEKSQVMPVRAAFSREPDERQFILDFVESSGEPDDTPIPIYSRVADHFSSLPALALFAMPGGSKPGRRFGLRPQRRNSSDAPDPIQPAGTAVVNNSRGTVLAKDGLQPVPLQDVARSHEIREKLRYTGGEALGSLLERLDMEALARCIRQEMGEIEPKMLRLLCLPLLSRSQLILRNRFLRRRSKQGRRLKLAKLFLQSGKRPEWMVISTLPVLPPELRPIVRLDGGVIVVSDLNKLYQKVLFRNDRLEQLRMVDLYSVGQAKRLLQEAVDGLLDNGKGGSIPIPGPNGRPLKSLSDGLKGKRGRFRQNLLGKRVDYSGRSVIVVGPSLQLHECGLPKEIAIELFQPFLSRLLMDRGVAENITAAKRFMSQDHPILWEMLQQLLQRHPVLLNRAPTLHRLGIQAFQPKLVHGRAILLHPLVCTAFNADFDGDQMAVHLPLSPQAQGEAWKLLWSRNNALSPATGQPILAPSQDMVLGCYYLTTTNPERAMHYRRAMGPIPSKESELMLQIPTVKPVVPSISMRDSTHEEVAMAITKMSWEDPHLKSLARLHEGSLRHSSIEWSWREEPADDSHGVPPTRSKAHDGVAGVLVSVDVGDKASDQEVASATSQQPNLIRLFSRSGAKGRYFSTLNESMQAYNQAIVGVHTSVWVRFNGCVERDISSEEPLEIRINAYGALRRLSTASQQLGDLRQGVSNQFIRTTLGRILVNSSLHLV